MERRHVQTALQLLALCLLAYPSGGNASSRRELSQFTIRPLIAFGFDAVQGEFPYMASCRRPSDRNHYCGATLLAPDIIITAAHCVEDIQDEPPPPKFPLVRIGGLFRENGKDSEDTKIEVFKTCRKVVHPEYTGNLLDGFDIALLRLNGTSSSMPVKIDGDLVLNNGTFLTATGFGAINNRREQATTLQKTDSLMYISNEECMKKAAKGATTGFPLTDKMLCAFDPEGSDACQGDSGGPLLVNAGFGFDGNREGERQDTLVGITSFGPPQCEDPGAPAVYTRISSLIEWINQTIAELQNPDAEGVEVGGDCDAEPPPPPEESNGGSNGPSEPADRRVTAEDIVAAVRDGDQKKATELIVKAVQEAKAAGESQSEVVAEAMQLALDAGLREAAGRALLAAIRSPEVASSDVRNAFFTLNG